MLEIAMRAESYLFSDPNASISKSRVLCELLAKKAVAHAGLYNSKDNTDVLNLSQFDTINLLYDRSIITAKVSQLFHTVRKKGNIGVHEQNQSKDTALFVLRMTRQIAIWFYKTFYDNSRLDIGPFVIPDDPEQDRQQNLEKMAVELERLRFVKKDFEERIENFKLSADQEQALRKEAEEKADIAYQDLEEALNLAQESEEKLNEQQNIFEQKLVLLSQSATKENTQKIVELSRDASDTLDINERDTRKLIDERLNIAGWIADTENITFSKGLRPQKNKNMAIAEWPTQSGPADYVLFIGLTPIAIVEAKRKSLDVAGAIEQAKRYSRSYILREFEVSLKNNPSFEKFTTSVFSGEYRIPFMFSTNGRAWLKQIATKSGIWFLDGRRPTNHSRPVQDWYSPEGLTELLKNNIDNAASILKCEPTDYLGLRDYQIEAIRAVEKALSEDRRSILLAMATGTGKTRTCLGLLYRLVKSRRFSRILFLVDRTSLGEQATDVFKSVHLENYKTFNDIYDIKVISDIRPEADTKLQVATIQGMMKRILFSEDDKNIPGIDQYDCIIIDECHRGYNLDREMNEKELFFRSERDYISKYSRVLDHFDAVKIGLTATPALHTTEIFGKPVYEYSYRKAVIEGYLVDHDPPLRIVTKLAENGMTWEEGAKIEIYNPKTGQVETVNTPDEVHFEIDRFNTQVITKNFNRVVCTELANHIDPDFVGKTLIFCANDNHADLVVMLLKEAMQKRWGTVEENAIVKITGKSDKPGRLIKRYKNEKFPAVGVTVDLLTTGIDVPEIDKLVFLRRVKSRILYEQMLGRATRKCSAIEKERFQIFDAVDLYSAIEDSNSMKPVVPDLNITFESLGAEFISIWQKENNASENDHLMQEIKDQFCARLNRKKPVFENHGKDKFSGFIGSLPDDFIKSIKAMSCDDLGKWFSENQDSLKMLDSIKKESKKGQIISSHGDKLVKTEVGYGENRRPEDYIESFKKYVEENINIIPALVVITQQPGSLTRAELKKLKLKLDLQGFNEIYLNNAWRDWKNVDIAADIIGYIRHFALGSPLIPYRERVRQALAKILGENNWTRNQRKWLERIGRQLEIETVFDKSAFDTGQFKSEGGFNRFNKIFEGKLEKIVMDMNQEIWSDRRVYDNHS